MNGATVSNQPADTADEHTDDPPPYDPFTATGPIPESLTRGLMGCDPNDPSQMMSTTFTVHWTPNAPSRVVINGALSCANQFFIDLAERLGLDPETFEAVSE